MKLVFSVFFWTFLAVSWTVMCCFVILLRAITFPFDPKGYIAHYVSCFSCFMFVYFNPFWRVRIEGRHKLPSRSAAILVSNHQSMADIAVLGGLYKPFKWVAKDSLFRIPLLGWTLSVNRYIRLLRGDMRSIIQMMRECTEWLTRGVPVMIFPEGTRSEDGNLREFNLGAFKLATRTGHRLFPIVLDGTADAIPKHGFALKHAVNVTVRVLDPVDPADFNHDANALMRHVHDLMKAELDTIRSQARNPGQSSSVHETAS
jgi:1-acyl-sn-glycerol-3-phosphate acyltransferase